MTREALATELLSMLERAKGGQQEIKRLSCCLRDEWRLLRELVEEYRRKRVELFKQELIARGMTWCTYCSRVIPESQAELMLFEGRERYSHGYEDAFYAFRGFSNLYRLCPACREWAADQHGWVGSYDSQAKDQSSFYAFRVEKRDDGYYARKFGNWVKLDDKKYSLGEPSSKLVERLAKELNLPPRIEIDSDWQSLEKRLVIDE